MSVTETHVGRPTSRVDGPLKVTGQAKYAAEYPAADLLHGYIVGSTIAAGRITDINLARARLVPGVVEIFTHENRGKAVPVVVLRDKKEQTLTITPDGKKRSSVEPGVELEEFFGSDEQAERTREVLAQLQPLFDSMAADARRRMEAARYSPELAQMMARLEVFAADPLLRENLETARKQVDAAAEAAKRAADNAGRLRMN